MTKKSGPSRTCQGVRGGMTLSEAHRLYGKGGFDCPEKNQVEDYLGVRREGKYVDNDTIKVPLTRNQRRLAKKLGIELKEAK